MANCTNCGAAVNEDSKFCATCGSPVRSMPQTQSTITGGETKAKSQPKTIPLKIDPEIKQKSISPSAIFIATEAILMLVSMATDWYAWILGEDEQASVPMI
ncbi:MAG: zinc ribbon domain-containing protein [Chloroflexota bacterium]|nr:zinc ribbon domain-containing protein [Chloroflexota bacterium]